MTSRSSRAKAELPRQEQKLPPGVTTARYSGSLNRVAKVLAVLEAEHALGASALA
jgi:hypothetical protein